MIEKRPASSPVQSQQKKSGLEFHYNSPVILTYAFFSFIVLILGATTQHQTTQMLFSAYGSSLADPLLYIRLFTHILGHINWDHFFNNFLIILLVGPILEEKYGSLAMFKMIIVTALITGLSHILFFDTALLGASGVVFMLVLLSSFANVQAGKIPLTLILVIAFFMGREILTGLGSEDDISQLTHVIGGVCGGIFGFWLGEKRSNNGSSGKLA